jgi:hypothetical protein
MSGDIASREPGEHGYALARVRLDAVPTTDHIDSNWSCQGTVRRKNGTEAPFKLKNVGPTDTISGARDIVRARHKSADATTQEIECYHYGSDSRPGFTDDDGLAGGDDPVDPGGPWSKYKACSNQYENDRKTCNRLPEDDKARRKRCWSSATLARCAYGQAERNRGNEDPRGAR